MITREQFVRRRPDVVHRPLAGGAVLLDLETGAYFSLNGVGALVWDLVGEGRTVGEVIDDLVARVEGAPPTVVDEVIAFFAQLAERDLVEIGVVSG